MSLLQKEVLKKRIGGGLPPMPHPGVGGGKQRAFGKQRDFTPVYWDKYFEKMHDVKVYENTFRIYECGSEGPVMFFLHGGGYSALSWAVLSKLLLENVACRCAAVDLRGHGDSVSTDDYNLSADVMSSDVGGIIEQLYGDDPPPIILVGHSMGGAIAVHTAFRNLVPSLVGLAVIDVVEGTALEALSSMQSFLKGRPKVFKSLEHAIEWCVKSGQICNLESAKVSMVGQIKQVDTDETAAAVLEHQHQTEVHLHTSGDLHFTNSNTITEEEEGLQATSTEVAHQPNIEENKSTNQISHDMSSNSSASEMHGEEFKKPEAPSVQYTWRLDLSQTEPFWRGWFQGLSDKFLSCNVPKLLILAGVDRLDKALTIGQMQGKFQMQVLSKSGHVVHEDVPDQVAEVMATFLVRQKLATPTANFQYTFPAC